MNIQRSILLSIFLISLISGCGYSPKSPAEANNTKAPIDVVKAYIHALEAGHWDEAEELLADNYRCKTSGDAWHKSGKKKRVLESYRAWRTAFPNFRFNEELMERMGNGVKLAVYYSGTHSDTLLIPGSGIPLIDSSGMRVRFPAEYHSYYVENDLIVFSKHEIPIGHGQPAILKSLLPIDTTAVED